MSSVCPQFSQNLIGENSRRTSALFVGAAVFCMILFSLRSEYPYSETGEYKAVEFAHFSSSGTTWWSEQNATDVGSDSEEKSLSYQWKPYLKELFDRLPSNFSSSHRNPCWYEDATLRCLPYFYQLGSYKCGTTDLWDKVAEHPDIIRVAKEPHWWAWRRFGYISLPIHGELVLKIRKLTGEKDDHSLQWYLNLYSYQATAAIEKNPKLVFGDASISNLWGLGDFGWEKKFPELEEPPFFLANIIRTFQPNAKITAILRDPVDKLWTTYMLGEYKRKSFKKHFENLVRESVDCEKRHSFKYCAFMRGKYPSMVLSNHLYQGIYYVYLQEWVNAFGVEKIHVIRLEDWKQDTATELNSVYQYLELDPVSPENMTAIIQRSTKNVNKKAKARNMVMSEEMRKRIQSFYRPWNKKLAELLRDPKFMWGY